MAYTWRRSAHTKLIGKACTDILIVGWLIGAPGFRSPVLVANGLGSLTRRLAHFVLRRLEVEEHEFEGTQLAISFSNV